MVVVAKVIETPDGERWVSLEDYQRLLKMYEQVVGFESNKQIIARAGVEEIPDESGNVYNNVENVENAEITRIMTVQITTVTTIKEGDVVRTKEETKEQLPDVIKAFIECDDVKVLDVQDFVMEKSE